MIHEHEQLEVASAGMDFPLAPDVERELERELADCPVCAERAAAYKTQMRMLARLPVVNASDATRRRVTAAAMTGRADTRSPMLLLLAASLLLAGALAATAVVGALLNNRTPTELGVVDPSPSPAPASVSTVAATPQASASLTRPEPGGPIDVEVAPGDFLDVVTTNLRVRSEPRVAGDSAMLEPFLQPGDRVVVLEGPVSASDYSWLRIAPFATRSADRVPDELPSGWVAIADHDGTPWVSSAEPDCPGGSVEIAALTALHPFERLACFQNDHLAFLALLEGDEETGWRAVERLDSQANQPYAVTVAPEVDAPFALSDIPFGRAVMLSGGFDRPGDFECPDEPIDDELLADLYCRSTFVLTSAVRAPHQFEVGTAAVTATDNLRVRSMPAVADESAKLNLLDQGTGVYVLGGPVVASGYLWYEVAVPSIRTSAGPLGGWVAVGSKTGEQWLDEDPEPCASSANLTFDQLADIARPAVAHRLLRCVERGALAGPVTVEARMRMECSDAPAAPDWLQDPPFTFVLTSLEGGAREVRAVAAESHFGLTCGAQATELHYHLEGHFADGAASDCRSGSSAPDIDANLARRLAEFDCRTKFVVLNGFVSGPGPTLPPPTPTPPPAP